MYPDGSPSLCILTSGIVPNRSCSMMWHVSAVVGALCFCTGLFCQMPYPGAVEAKGQRQLTHRWPGVGHAAWGMASEDSCSAWARVRAESAFLLRLCSGPLGPTCWALQHMTVRRWANALTGGPLALAGSGVCPLRSLVLACSVRGKA